MDTFHLRIELNGREAAFKVERLDETADAEGFMRYQISTFNKRAEIFVNTAAEPLERFDGPGLTLEETFTRDETDAIATAIRAYNESRQLTFDCASFDFK